MNGANGRCPVCPLNHSNLLQNVKQGVVNTLFTKDGISNKTNTDYNLRLVSALRQQLELFFDNRKQSKEYTYWGHYTSTGHQNLENNVQD